MSTAFPIAANDTTLITLLQSVQDHLDQELSHLNTLVERKTIQLQGIKSILEDARNGSTTAPLESEVSASIAEPAASTFNSNPFSEPVVALELELQAVVEEAAPAVEESIPTEPAQSIAPVAPSSTKKPRRGKSSTGKQPSSVRTKPPTAPSKPSKSKPLAQPTELRQALHPQFQDKTLAQAVGEVLAQAPGAMNAKAVAFEMYDGLTVEDLSRATKSIATILAAGRTKGSWQSPGKGLYQSRATDERSALVTEALSGAA